MLELRRNIVGSMATMIVLLGSMSATHAQYGGGIGTPDDPYLIQTAEHLNAIGVNPVHRSCHFKLVADIDLSAYTGTEFNVIGADWNHRFTGIFDGNGHIISNFTYTADNGRYVGLFGYVHGHGTEIKNLGLTDARVTGGAGSTTGALVGHLNAGAISNCYVRAGTVSGDSEVGGLIGDNFNGTVRNCYATGAVAAIGDEVGGLAGSNSGRIFNCYATGTITGNRYVGGLAGSNCDIVVECYASAMVVGNEETGGLIGGGYGKVTGGFWDIETSGQAVSAGGQGLTTSQMQDPNAFVAAGWDFFGPSDGPSDIWAAGPKTGYPILWWEVPEEELPDLPSFSGGSGTSEDPYRIASAGELNRIGHNPRLMACHFKLVNDIDLAGIESFAISSDVFPFTGDFDGNNKIISNFVQALAEANNVGFFRYVAANATIRNLTLIDPHVTVKAGKQIGSLVGHLSGGTVTNCRVRGGHVRGTYDVGGLVGLNSGMIGDCFADATVSADYIVGGLAGSTRSTMARCHSVGTVTGRKYSVGGLAGSASGVVRNCSAGCTVTGDENVGGLVGFLQDASIVNSYVREGSVSGNKRVGGLVGYFNVMGIVANCYAGCPVVGPAPTGGLVGSSTFGLVKSSFWNVETSGQASSAGGTSKTTAEMADPNTFIEAGWDFFGPTDGPGDIWTFDSAAQHPILWWQVPEDQWPDLPTFAAGEGTPEDPYRIDSAQQLCTIGHNPRLMECSFKLTNDIDLTDTDFFPIGGLAVPFTAVFDGSGHAVSNLTIVPSDTGYAGLFGFIDGWKAQIKSLRIIEPNIEGSQRKHADYVGALAGYLSNGALLDCSVQGGRVAGDQAVGGLAGCVVSGAVRNCRTTNTVSGDSKVGGLTGQCYHAMVTDCFATGAVTGSNWGTGGLVGDAHHVLMRSCYATGNVTGDAWTGGLVGDADDSAIADCYATGDVSGASLTGGLVGGGGRALADCHATGDVLGSENIGGLAGDNGGVVTGCYSAGAVEGTSSVGGLIGDNWQGVLEHNHSNATVNGDRNVGGLVGYNDSYSAITDCYATGSVLGQENVGGLVGRNGELIDVEEFYGEFPGFISNCYSTGPVSGQTQIGGLVGLHGLGSVTASFWDNETSGLTASDAGSGKSTAAMQSAATFLEAGWDFTNETGNGTEDIWWILEGEDYPRLWWELLADRPGRE